MYGNVYAQADTQLHNEKPVQIANILHFKQKRTPSQTPTSGVDDLLT